jgi:segregation and condensation protein B
METAEKKSLIEALLFISGEPVTLADIKNNSEIPETELKLLLDEMITEYKERNGGMLIVEIANGSTGDS